MIANVNGRGIHKFAEQTNLCRDSAHAIQPYARYFVQHNGLLKQKFETCRCHSLNCHATTRSLSAPPAPSVRGKLGLFSIRREKYNMSYVFREDRQPPYVEFKLAGIMFDETCTLNAGSIVGLARTFGSALFRLCGNCRRNMPTN